MAFFKKCSSVEQSFFIVNLKPVLFLPEDYIIREGERGDSLYFINKGEVEVSLKDDNGADNLIGILKDGVVFGEISLLTKLKRTATAISTDYSNCAYLEKEDVDLVQENFPHIAKQFKDKIKDYRDEKMNFRKLMIRNIHYLKELNDNIINEIICNLSVKRYAKGATILKSGDVSNRLMFLRQGEIDIKVSNKVVESTDDGINDEL